MHASLPLHKAQRSETKGAWYVAILKSLPGMIQVSTSLLPSVTNKHIRTPIRFSGIKSKKCDATTCCCRYMAIIAGISCLHNSAHHCQPNACCNAAWCLSWCLFKSALLARTPLCFFGRPLPVALCEEERKKNGREIFRIVIRNLPRLNVRRLLLRGK